MALMSSDGDELPGIARAAQREWGLADAEIRSAFLGNRATPRQNLQEDSDRTRTLSKRLRRDFEEERVDSLARTGGVNLLQAMVEERQNPPSPNFHDQLNFDMDQLPEIFAEENLNRFMDETEQLNERIIARAQGFLASRNPGVCPAPSQSVRAQQSNLKNDGGALPQWGGEIDMNPPLIAAEVRGSDFTSPVPLPYPAPCCRTREASVPSSSRALALPHTLTRPLREHRP